MRVALVVPGFSASEEDWCIPQLLDLVRVLAEHVELSVIALRYPHHTSPYSVYGADVYPLGGAERRGPRRLWLLGRALVGVVRRARQRPYDLMHAMWAHEPGFVASAAGRITGTPVIVSMRGGELAELSDIGYGGQLSWLNRWLIDRSLDSATRVTVGSHYMAESAGERWDPSRWSVIPFGVDTDRFTPPSEEPDRNESSSNGARAVAMSPAKRNGDFELLHVASLIAVKDQRLLLRAFAGAAQWLPDARLSVVGDGNARAELERLAQQLGVSERVRFHGEVRHDRLPDMYRRADVCVVTSRWESQAMVALEAAACGCPVIGTPVGVLPELGEGARTIDGRSPEALSTLITETLADGQALSTMKRAALESVRERYALRVTARQLIDLYEEVIAAN